MTATTCPICRKSGLVSTVKRSRLPAMQNYVFRHIELAQMAKSGRFDLAACPACGFAHNTSFDPALVDYDEGYDNSVPSSVMTTYYKELATYLHEKYSLDNRLIVDVGCGKGTFLKVMCEMFTRVRGLGIDPSYEGDSQIDDGRIEFVKDFFSERHIGERPSLVVCRHVVEHIPHPMSFLKTIHSALEAFPETQLYFEVPDTNWIIENSAFWDFCYEHCNYFTPNSLSNVLELSGFTPHTIRTAFGNQYVCVETGNPKDKSLSRSDKDDTASLSFVNKLTRYSGNELALMSGIHQRFSGLKREGWSIAVWGMATKGVVFSLLVDTDRTLIDFCIDMNPNKQGCFVPLTGHSIEAPEMLRKVNSKPLAVVVMNPNYSYEIRNTCKALSIEPVFMDATGNKV